MHAEECAALGGVEGGQLGGNSGGSKGDGSDGEEAGGEGEGEGNRGGGGSAGGADGSDPMFAIGTARFLHVRLPTRRAGLFFVLLSYS